MKMDYARNVQLALSLGFEEREDHNAYKGKYYVKHGIIWIHDISALKAKLKIRSDNELRELNYDVDSYHKYISHTNEMVDREIERIKGLIFGGDSVLCGLTDAAQDPDTLNTMAALADEGFDDEILADLAHQMSKN